MKVVLIVLENTNYEAALAQPFLSSLKEKGALLTQYYAITRPSQPNYIALISGSTYGVDNGNMTLDALHLGDLLNQRKKTWKNYAEDYPGDTNDCYLGKASGAYARKHVPFLSFKNIQDNNDQCAKVVNASQFLDDLYNDRLPDFSFYTPNNKNNGHDTGVGYADKWLSDFLSPILQKSQDSGQNSRILENTLFIVTFDEVGSGDAPDQYRVATLFVGAGVTPGVTSNQEYDHFCLLKTIESIFRLPSLGKHDEQADPIDDIWK